jgi:hypothetical protein
VKISYRLIEGAAVRKITPTAQPAAPKSAAIAESRLQFRLVADANDTDAEQVPDHDGKRMLQVRREILLDDSAVAGAAVGATEAMPTIDVTFTESGGKRFAEITGAHRGRQLAIVFDGKVLTAPTLQSAITGGHAQITGSLTVGEAEAFVKAMTEGSRTKMPAPPASKIQGEAAGPDSRRHPANELFINNHKFGADNGCSSDVPLSGQSTCGHPGHVSEVAWKFLRTDSRGDVYEFTRKYPSDTAAAKTDTKEVTYAGEALTLWEDDTQKIILLPKP